MAATLKNVAIFGGGIGGLTVAQELAERGGFKIIIYEKTNTCGGKAKSLMTSNGYPGEHSVRTVSATYYHFRDTLKRIPKNNKTVFDYVIPCGAGSRKFLMFKDYEMCVLPSYFPFTWSGYKELYRFIEQIKKIIPSKELFDFNRKLIASAAMSSQRRLATLEKISWDEYMEVDKKSKNFRYYLHRLPEFYVAAKGNANAKSMSMLVEKSLYLPLIHPILSQYSSLDIFSGSTNKALIDPWVSYLKKLGVEFRMSCTVKAINVDNQQIENVMIESDQHEETIKANIYVFALPVEVMTPLVMANPKIKNLAPSLKNIDKLNTEESSGLQLFLIEDIKEKFPQGWTAFLDSPWSIVGLYQDHLEFDLKPPVKGFITLAWSNFDEPGVVYNKPARACTAEEIKNEMIEQMSMHKGMEFLRDVKIYTWHIDDEIEFAPNNGAMIRHKAPLFIQLPNSYQNQPNAYTEIPNLFLASDYVRTSYDLATMESANEAGRRAVNAILKYTHHPARPCFVKNNIRTGFGLFQWIDKFIFKIQSVFTKKT